MLRSIPGMTLKISHEYYEYYELQRRHHQRRDAGGYDKNVPGEVDLLHQAGLSDDAPDAHGCSPVQEVPEDDSQEQEELVVLHLDAHEVAEDHVEDDEHEQRL